jgi:hypothetical protein
MSPKGVADQSTDRANIVCGDKSPTGFFTVQSGVPGVTNAASCGTGVLRRRSSSELVKALLSGGGPSVESTELSLRMGKFAGLDRSAHSPLMITHFLQAMKPVQVMPEYEHES